METYRVIYYDILGYFYKQACSIQMLAFKYKCDMKLA